MASKGRRRQNADPPRRGLAAAALDQTLANPMAAIGSIVMLAVGSAILTNALMMQPGAHPAPLFHNTSPLPSGRVPPPRVGEAGEAPKAADRIGDLLGSAGAIDPQLVADTQSALKALGVYEGAVDGLDGPMTRAAIRAFQTTHGLEPSGEPSQDLLTILNVAVPHGAGVPAPEEAATAAEFVEPAVPAESPALAVPLPRPSPLRSSAVAAEGTVRSAGNTAPNSVAPVTLRYTPDAADRPSFEPETAAPAPVREAALEAPQEDPRLARIQEALDIAGYGPLRADGIWSQETSDAIRRFEENRGLAITGRINEAFLAELVKIGGLITP